MKHCSRECANSRSWTEQDKEIKSLAAKNSIKVKEAFKTNPLNLRKGQKTDYYSTCQYCNETIKDTRYRKKRKYHKECWNKISGGFRENSTILHKSVYNGFSMDSGSEKEFAMLLDSNNIQWVKNKTVYFPYVDGEGKPRKYYPDFYLSEYDLWVEIKSKYYADKDKLLKYKLNAVPNIELLYDTEIKNLCGE